MPTHTQNRREIHRKRADYAWKMSLFGTYTPSAKTIAKLRERSRDDEHMIVPVGTQLGRDGSPTQWIPVSPHAPLAIPGATGSGKTVFCAEICASLKARYGSDVSVHFIDPKGIGPLLICDSHEWLRAPATVVNEFVDEYGQDGTGPERGHVLIVEEPYAFGSAGDVDQALLRAQVSRNISLVVSSQIFRDPAAVPDWALGNTLICGGSRVSPHFHHSFPLHEYHGYEQSGPFTAYYRAPGKNTGQAIHPLVCGSNGSVVTPHPKLAELIRS